LGLGPPPGPPPGLPQHCILAAPPPGFYNNWPHPFLPFSFFSLPREASKYNRFLEVFLAYYFMKAQLQHLSKIKSHKKGLITVKIKVYLAIFA
jgi:hypothetical protein